jgi:hypothetical protein
MQVNNFMKKEQPIVRIVINGLDKPTRRKINKIKSYLVQKAGDIEEDFTKGEKYSHRVTFRLF